MRIVIIVAASENNVIGNNGSIPWHLPDDLTFFRRKTEGHPVIMGRKTFDSLPNGPLPNRENIIVTRSRTYDHPNCKEASSLEEAIMFAKRNSDKESVFIIGGGEIYKEAMDVANVVYLTRVHTEIEGDVFFPELDTNEWEEVAREEHAADEKHNYAFTFLTFKRRSRLQL